jgi:mitogen-activated protein kinase 1/3
LKVKKPVSSLAFKRQLVPLQCGAVCKALDREVCNRPVALKRVPDTLISVACAKRVLREVVVLNRLNHPNIIKIYNIFFTPATSGARKFDPVAFKLVPVSIDLYMAFELAEGGDLYEMRGEMGAAEVRSLMHQLASAIQYLHDAGVWHRDIKSANTLCGRNRMGGRVVKICDFGLARGATRTAASWWGCTRCIQFTHSARKRLISQPLSV